MTINGSSQNRVSGTRLGASNPALRLTDAVVNAVHTASTSNYIGKNSLQSTDFGTNQDHGAGVWLNNNASGNFVFGNVLTGFVENGIALFQFGGQPDPRNYTYHNKNGGINLTTDADSYPTGFARHDKKKLFSKSLR